MNTIYTFDVWGKILSAAIIMHFSLMDIKQISVTCRYERSDRSERSENKTEEKKPSAQHLAQTRSQSDISKGFSNAKTVSTDWFVCQCAWNNWMNEETVDYHL